MESSKRHIRPSKAAYKLVSAAELVGVTNRLCLALTLLGLLPARLLAAAACDTSEGRPRLLDNPGLEPGYRSAFANNGNISGRVAEYWFDNTDWAGPWVKLLYSEDRSVVAQGTSSQRVEVPWRAEAVGKDGAEFVQFAVQKYLKPGRYTASIKVRAVSSMAGGDLMTAALALRMAGAPYDYYGRSADVKLANGAWTELLMDQAVIPGSASGIPLSMLLLVYAWGTGTLWIDDASLCSTTDLYRPPPPPSPPVCGPGATELLQNPGFEADFADVPSNANGASISGRMPNWWMDNTDWAGRWVMLQYALEGSVVAQGAQSLKVDIPWRPEAVGKDGAEFMQFGQVLDLTPGRYAASIRVRAAIAQGGTPIRVQLALRQAGEPYSDYGLGREVALTDGVWVVLSVEEAEVPSQLAPGSAAETLLLVYAWGTGTLWLDDAHLCAAAAGTGAALRPPPPPARSGGPPESSTCAAAGSGAAQLLDNPGFDGGWSVVRVNDGNISGQVAHSWFDNTDWAGPWVKLVFAVDTSQVAQGVSSQRVEMPYRSEAAGGDGAEFLQFAQGVQLRPGRYSVSIKLRGVSSAELRGRKMLAFLGLRLAGEPYSVFGSSMVALEDGAWTEVALQGALVPGDSSNGAPVDTYLIVSASGAGTLWMDDAHLCASSPTDHPSSVNPPKDTPIPPEYFCLNANHMFDQPGYLWPAMQRFKIFRTWDSALIWANMQPSARGQFDWAEFDQMITQARAHGQRVMFTLGQTPAWASSQPETPNVYGLGYGAVPSRLEDWSVFVEAVARRAGDTLYAFEIWNEPDIGGVEGFYTGTPQEMVPLERATREAMQAAGSSALLLSPAISGGSNLFSIRWLDLYFTLGGGRYCDGVAMHMYDQPPDGPGARASVANVRALISAHGLVDSRGAPLRIWNTEGGLTLDELGGPLEAPGSRTAAGVVGRQLLFSWAMGLQSYCAYAYDNCCFTGLSVPGDPSRLADTGVAYEVVGGWLAGARMVSYECDAAGICNVQLLRPGGLPPTRVVWSTAGPQQLSLAAAWGKLRQTTDVAGKRSLLPRKKRGVRIAINDQPLLLEP